MNRLTEQKRLKRKLHWSIHLAVRERDTCQRHSLCTANPFQWIDFVFFFFVLRLTIGWRQLCSWYRSSRCSSFHLKFDQRKMKRTEIPYVSLCPSLVENTENIERCIALVSGTGWEVIASGDLDEKTSTTNKGYYIRPTVVLNLDDESKLKSDEILGPVGCIVPFDNDDEVNLFVSPCLTNLWSRSTRWPNEWTICNMVFVVVYGSKGSVERIKWLNAWMWRRSLRSDVNETWLCRFQCATVRIGC